MRKPAALLLLFVVLPLGSYFLFLTDDAPPPPRRLSGAGQALNLWAAQRAYPGKALPRRGLAQAFAYSKANLAEDPAKVNSDPRGGGWFFKIKIAEPSELDGLMDEAAYNAYVEGLG